MSETQTAILRGLEDSEKLQPAIGSEPQCECTVRILVTAVPTTSDSQPVTTAISDTKPAPFRSRGKAASTIATANTSAQSHQAPVRTAGISLGGSSSRPNSNAAPSTQAAAKSTSATGLRPLAQLRS